MHCHAVSFKNIQAAYNHALCKGEVHQGINDIFSGDKGKGVSAIFVLKIPERFFAGVFADSNKQVIADKSNRITSTFLKNGEGDNKMPPINLKSKSILHK